MPEFIQVLDNSAEWIILVIIIVGITQNLIALVQLIVASLFIRKSDLYDRDESLWQRRAPSAPPIALISPAFNEEKTIIQSIKSLMALHYPNFEIIVVNDGSKDNTLELLIKHFELEPCTRAYEEIAKHQLIKLLPYCQDITLAVGLPLRLDNKVYNTIAIIENGEIKGFVAKQFMAIDGVHYEFRWFTPWLAFQQTTVEINGKQVPFGDLTFELKGIHYGFEICEDAWRGEVRPGYRLCDRQVDLIFNPSASHFAMNKTLERKDLVTQSSSLFNCYYFYVNLLGNEAGRMIFDGEILLAKEGKLLGRNQLLSFESVQVRAFVLENKVQTIDPFHSK